MKPQDRNRLSERKARIEKRLDPEWQEEMERPMLSGANTRYCSGAAIPSASGRAEGHHP